MKSKANRENGFSLIELLITLVILIVVVGLILSMLAQLFRMSNTTYKSVDTDQGVRNAIEFITRDLLLTGDGLSKINNIRVKDDFVADYLSRLPVESPPGSGFARLGFVTSDNQVPAGTVIAGTAPVARVLANTDRTTIIRIDPDFTPQTVSSIDTDKANETVVTVAAAIANQFDVGEIYLFTTGGEATLGVVTAINGRDLVLANGDVYGLNEGGASGTMGPIAKTNGVANSVAMMRVQLVQYFVKEDDLHPNDKSNLLIRRVYGVNIDAPAGGGVSGKGFTDSVIAENITDLQFTYRLDNKVTGASFVRSVDVIGASEQALVRDIGFSVAARPRGAAAAGIPEYRIESVSSTGIRNLEFRDALQPEPTVAP